MKKEKKWWDDVDQKKIDAAYGNLANTKFPAPTFSPKERRENIQQFARYAQKDHKLFQNGRIRRSTHGTKIVQAYHPHRWGERTSEKPSFKEEWKNPKALKYAIRLTIARGQEPTRENVGRTVRKYRIGAIPAHFFPAQSAAVIRKYTKPGDTVLDPFMGYGGSIPAASALNRRFVGIDINPKSFKGNQRMKRDLERTLKLSPDKIRLIYGDSREKLKELPENSVDLVYTSPPYFDRERYTGDGQSYKIGNYRNWLTEFYVPSLAGMAHTVHENGTIAVNIAPVRKDGILKYPLDKHTIQLAKELGLKYKGRKKLVLGGLRVGNQGLTLEQQRYEPVLIFKKVGHTNPEKAKALASRLSPNQKRKSSSI